MSKVTIFAGGIAGMAWVVPAMQLYFAPPGLIDVKSFEIATDGRMVMDRVVNNHVPPEGEQAILSITIEGPNDEFVCSGQRVINLRTDESTVKRWDINDWFSVPCPKPIKPGSIAHATWVPIDRDEWSIVSARWVVTEPLPPL